MSAIDLDIRPDEDEPEAAEVLVTVSINGRDHTFLLDTGAGTTSVAADDELAALPAAGTRQGSGVFGPADDDLVVVKHLRCGPISAENVTVARRPPNDHVRNLLGMDVLQAVACDFRFDEARVEVNPTISAEVEALLQPLWVDEKYHPYVDIAFANGTQASTVWDTGAGITLADLNFVQRAPSLFEAAGQSTGTDSTGASQETPMFRMAACTIGGHAFAPITVAAVDLGQINATLSRPMDLILGYNLLNQAHWLFDFPRQRWAVTRMLNHA